MAILTTDPRQTVLPGAEEISRAALVQRKSDQPLRPRVPQKPVDLGLFSDGAQQLDLVDMVRRVGK